jgi:hypothetical protein
MCSLLVLAKRLPSRLLGREGLARESHARRLVRFVDRDFKLWFWPFVRFRAGKPAHASLLAWRA